MGISTIPMKLAINQATTMPRSFEEDMTAYKAAGFTAVELWLDKLKVFLEKNSIRDAKNLLSDRGLTPVGACFHFGVMLSEGKERKANLDEFKTKLEICQALNVPVLVVPTDFPEKTVGAKDYDKAIAGLIEAADLAQAYNVSLAVEFIKGAKLVGTLKTALDLVRKTEKKNIGIALDTFHLYVGASKIEDVFGMKSSELLLVHINDLKPVYQEIAEDKHRVFPGEGILPLKEILDAVSRIGYDGYYSLELFNEDIWKEDIKETAELAFKKTTEFLKDYQNG